MPRSLSLALLLVSFPTLAWGADVAEVRSLEAFHLVDVAAGIHVEVSPGAPHVEVRGEAADVAEVTTEVVEGSLHIGWKPHSGWSVHHSATVVIALPQLDGLAASGGAQATVHGLALPEAELSGGASLTSDSLSGALKLKLSGGATARLSGPGLDSLAIHASGGSEVHAIGLPARVASVEESGGGTVEIMARETLSAALSGGSQLVVQGHPQVVSQHVSGGAHLSFQ